MSHGPSGTFVQEAATPRRSRAGMRQVFIVVIVLTQYITNPGQNQRTNQSLSFNAGPDDTDQYSILIIAFWAVELFLAFILPKLNDTPARKKRPRVLPMMSSLYSAVTARR